MSDEEAEPSLGSFDPDYRVHPGETLRETLDELGLTQRELAKRIGVTEGYVSLIVNGKHGISPRVAVLLEQATGVSVRHWSSLQARYDDVDDEMTRRSEGGRMAEQKKPIETKHVNAPPSGRARGTSPWEPVIDAAFAAGYGKWIVAESDDEGGYLSRDVQVIFTLVGKRFADVRLSDGNIYMSIRERPREETG